MTSPRVDRNLRRGPLGHARNLSPLNRFLFGFWALFLGERRIRQVAAILKPSTPLRFREALKLSG